MGRTGLRTRGTTTTQTGCRWATQEGWLRGARLRCWHPPRVCLSHRASSSLPTCTPLPEKGVLLYHIFGFFEVGRISNRAGQKAVCPAPHHRGPRPLNVTAANVPPPTLPLPQVRNMVLGGLEWALSKLEECEQRAQQAREQGQQAA